MSQLVLIFSLTLLFASIHIRALPVLPNPDPASVQSHTFLRPPSPPATIPAFPEQSNVAGCQLDLPKELFRSVKSACGTKPHHKPDPSSYSDHLHKTRCCPVLAAWLYSAYSRTALRASFSRSKPQTASSYEMPVLPDDSETCVDTLEKAFANRGIELARPNETCDAVSCNCGIRLHPLSCSEAFSVDSTGQLVGSDSVSDLERDCLSSNGNGYAGLGGCSKCLNSLYLLSGDTTKSMEKSEERTNKMRSRDCELMGLTWLLNKNRSAYIHTVSAVLRALMMNTDDTAKPRFCSLNSDGMPLAVDSSEINDQSSSSALSISLYLYMLALSLLYVGIVVLPARFY